MKAKQRLMLLCSAALLTLALLAGALSVSAAVRRAASDNVLQLFALKNGETTLGEAQKSTTVELSGMRVSGYLLEGEPGDEITIVPGSLLAGKYSLTCGAQTAKSADEDGSYLGARLLLTAQKKLKTEVSPYGESSAVRVTAADDIAADAGNGVIDGLVGYRVSLLGGGTGDVYSVYLLEVNEKPFTLIVLTHGTPVSEAEPAEEPPVQEEGSGFSPALWIAIAAAFICAGVTTACSLRPRAQRPDGKPPQTKSR